MIRKKKLMNLKICKSAVTVSGSLAGFYFAKLNGKDLLPLVLIGGFAGAVAAEMLEEKIKKKK